MLNPTFSTSFFEKNGYLKQKTLKKIPTFLKKKVFFPLAPKRPKHRRLPKSHGPCYSGICTHYF